MTTDTTAYPSSLTHEEQAYLSGLPEGTQRYLLRKYTDDNPDVIKSIMAENQAVSLLSDPQSKTGGTLEGAMYLARASTEQPQVAQETPQEIPQEITSVSSDPLALELLNSQTFPSPLGGDQGALVPSGSSYLGDMARRGVPRLFTGLATRSAKFVAEWGILPLSHAQQSLFKYLNDKGINTFQALSDDDFDLLVKTLSWSIPEVENAVSLGGLIPPPETFPGAVLSESGPQIVAYLALSKAFAAYGLANTMASGLRAAGVSLANRSAYFWGATKFTDFLFKSGLAAAAMGSDNTITKAVVDSYTEDPNVFIDWHDSLPVWQRSLFKFGDDIASSLLGEAVFAGAKVTAKATTRAAGRTIKGIPGAEEFVSKMLKGFKEWFNPERLKTHLEKEFVGKTYETTQTKPGVYAVKPEVAPAAPAVKPAAPVADAVPVPSGALRTRDNLLTEVPMPRGALRVLDHLPAEVPPLSKFVVEGSLVPFEASFSPVASPESYFQSTTPLALGAPEAQLTLPPPEAPIAGDTIYLPPPEAPIAEAYEGATVIEVTPLEKAQEFAEGIRVAKEQAFEDAIEVTPTEGGFVVSAPPVAEIEVAPTPSAAVEVPKAAPIEAAKSKTISQMPSKVPTVYKISEATLKRVNLWWSDVEVRFGHDAWLQVETPMDADIIEVKGKLELYPRISGLKKDAERKLYHELDKLLRFYDINMSDVEKIYSKYESTLMRLVEPVEGTDKLRWAVSINPMSAGGGKYPTANFYSGGEAFTPSVKIRAGIRKRQGLPGGVPSAIIDPGNLPKSSEELSEILRRAFDNEFLPEVLEEHLAPPVPEVSVDLTFKESTEKPARISVTEPTKVVVELKEADATPKVTKAKAKTPPTPAKAAKALDKAGVPTKETKAKVKKAVAAKVKAPKETKAKVKKAVAAKVKAPKETPTIDSAAIDALREDYHRRLEIPQRLVDSKAPKADILAAQADAGKARRKFEEALEVQYRGREDGDLKPVHVLAEFYSDETARILSVLKDNPKNPAALAHLKVYEEKAAAIDEVLNPKKKKRGRPRKTPQTTKEVVVKTDDGLTVEELTRRAEVMRENILKLAKRGDDPEDIAETIEDMKSEFFAIRDQITKLNKRKGAAFNPYEAASEAFKKVVDAWDEPNPSLLVHVAKFFGSPFVLTNTIALADMAMSDEPMDLETYLGLFASLTALRFGVGLGRTHGLKTLTKEIAPVLKNLTADESATLASMLNAVGKTMTKGTNFKKALAKATLEGSNEIADKVISTVINQAERQLFRVYSGKEFKAPKDVLSGTTRGDHRLVVPEIMGHPVHILETLRELSSSYKGAITKAGKLESGAEGRIWNRIKDFRSQYGATPEASSQLLQFLGLDSSSSTDAYAFLLAGDTLEQVFLKSLGDITPENPSPKAIAGALQSLASFRMFKTILTSPTDAMVSPVMTEAQELWARSTALGELMEPETASVPFGKRWLESGHRVLMDLSYLNKLGRNGRHLLFAYMNKLPGDPKFWDSVASLQYQMLLTNTVTLRASTMANIGAQALQTANEGLKGLLSDNPRIQLGSKKYLDYYNMTNIGTALKNFFLSAQSGTNVFNPRHVRPYNESLRNLAVDLGLPEGSSSFLFRGLRSVADSIGVTGASILTAADAAAQTLTKGATLSKLLHQGAYDILTTQMPVENITEDAINDLIVSGVANGDDWTLKAAYEATQEGRAASFQGPRRQPKLPSHGSEVQMDLSTLGKATQGLVEFYNKSWLANLLQPFLNTSLRTFDTGVDFSPFGLAEGAVSKGSPLRASSKGLEASQKAILEEAKLDKFTKALTGVLFGSAAYAILSVLGAEVTQAGSEGDLELKNLTGARSGDIVFTDVEGNKGVYSMRNHSWLLPSLNLVTLVAKSMSSPEPEDVDFARNWFSTLGTVLDAATSDAKRDFLKLISDAHEVITKGDGEKVIERAVDLWASLLSRYDPSVVRQLMSEAQGYVIKRNGEPRQDLFGDAYGMQAPHPVGALVGPRAEVPKIHPLKQVMAAAGVDTSVGAKFSWQGENIDDPELLTKLRSHLGKLLKNSDKVLAENILMLPDKDSQQEAAQRVLRHFKERTLADNYQVVNEWHTLKKEQKDAKANVLSTIERLLTL